MATPSIAERLETYSIPEPNSGCMLWAASTTSLGYGVIRIERKLYLAHRVSWALVNGSIPAGMLVCHKCDVPGCINPGHMFLGTHGDNSSDKVSKGRHSRGANTPLAKITEDQVLAIRADRRPSREIGAMYGLHARHVRKIKSGDRWQHIPITRDRSPANRSLRP